ncbi:cytochrome c oxidase subunit IV [Glaciihabitans tibetensis]|uniref:cytochrome-c oxidase n=1 Tax=Glaciihabitans tibetensis TaxID=1266600 RepID=A0A2T0V5I2_9MICO|nr:cytochrome c oxidase subunit 4 [Glaciihabitans tibetensis]PRY65442.1 cytochrome c oxidase subunit IV [Glaciihabitans tibetensis]
MRASIKLFWLLAAFFLVAAVGYTVWTYIYNQQGLATDPTGGQSGVVEWIGTIGLAFCAAASAFIAFYATRTHRSQGGELPEDRTDANIDDGEAEQGFFSPWSWWPIVLAASAALLFLGVAVGAWIAFIGVGIGVIALVGWVYEYHRGYFGH